MPTFDDRITHYSRARLGGLPVPDDLRALLWAHWEGRSDLSDLLHITLLEPDEVHPLLDDSYVREDERDTPSTKAVFAAAREVSRHLHVVARGGKGWIGYWTHPGEPRGRPAPIVEIDTESTFWRMSGRTLAEACAADVAYYTDDPPGEFARLADRLAELGVALSTRDYDALHEPELEVDPDELFDMVNDAEFERLTAR
ncbi:hypothetical protein [Marinactinospora rubrisoli]|uniref:Uncharacterized protein n=1 Tax=Marinactinospora rubrisoli TaxID=2715399 RepID=A0ABW2KI27_9ACTN